MARALSAQRGDHKLWIHGDLLDEDFGKIVDALANTLEVVRITNLAVVADSLELSAATNSADLTTDSIDDVVDLARNAHSLKELIIEQCLLTPARVTALANGLLACSSLHYLNLHGGLASEDGAKALAELVATSRSLRSFTLDHCKLGPEGLPFLAHGIRNTTSLKEITFAWEGVAPVPNLLEDGARMIIEALHDNTTLQIVRFRGVGLPDMVADRVCGSLHSSKTLVELDMTNNELENIAGFGLLLDQNESLQTLGLAKNQIGDAGARALSAGLARHQALRSLDLWSNEVGDEGLISLGASVASHPSLQKLNLRLLSFGASAVERVPDFLDSRNVLVELSLQECKLGERGAASLGPALAGTRHLEHLNLKQNEINALGAKALGSGLAQNTSLRELLLGENQVADEGTIALALGLAKHPRVTLLDLGENQIGDAGASALGDCIKENKTLLDLTLWYNQIGDVGAGSLAAGLGSLRSLYLGRNPRVTDLSADAFAANLGDLKVLDLFGTGLSDEGVKALSATIAENTTLREFNINNVPVTDEGAKALASALARNNSIVQLGMNFKYIGRPGLEALVSALETNMMLVGDVEFLGMGMFADGGDGNDDDDDDYDDDDEDDGEGLEPLADAMESHFKLNEVLARVRTRLEDAEKTLLELKFAAHVCGRVCRIVAATHEILARSEIQQVPASAAVSAYIPDLVSTPQTAAKLRVIVDVKRRIVATLNEIRVVAATVPLVAQFLVDFDPLPPLQTNKRRRLE